MAAYVIHKKSLLNKSAPFKYPVLLFALAMVISLIYSQDRQNSSLEIYKYISAILLLYIGASLGPQEKTRLIKTIVWASLVISLLAIYQYFFGFRHTQAYMAKHNISSSFALDYIQRRRIFFPFVTPNILAGYLAMILPLSFIYERKDLFIIPLLLALLLTKSLGAILSILLVLVVYLLLRRKLRKRQILYLAGLVLTIILIFFSRAATKTQHTSPSFSALMRMGYWKDTIEIIKAFPLTGVGIGNFNLQQSRYTHNSYLQIWAEMGILGAAAFLWLIIASFKIGAKKIKEAKNNSLNYSLLLLASAIFCVHNIFDFSFFLPEVALIWWVILGMVFS